MVQKALDKMFPAPKNQLGQPQTTFPGGGSVTPYVKDLFPSEGLVVFERVGVLWGGDYSFDENKGVATVSNVRRVKTEYVDVADEDEADAEESLKEVSPPGREKQVKKLKKIPGIENPWAVAWSQYNK